MTKEELITNLVEYRHVEGGLAVLGCIREALDQMDPSAQVDLEHVSSFVTRLLREIESFRGAA